MDHIKHNLKTDRMEHYRAIFRIHPFEFVNPLFFLIITVLVKRSFTEFDNCKTQSCWFVFSRTEDLVNAQDLRRRMTESGTYHYPLDSTVFKQKLTDLITQLQYLKLFCSCLLYTSPSPRDQRGSRMPSSA